MCTTNQTSLTYLTPIREDDDSYGDNYIAQEPTEEYVKVVVPESIKAIKIDVYTQSIYQVVVYKKGKSYLESMYETIGCTYIDFVRMITQKNEDLIIDDEALLKSEMPPSFDFVRNNKPYPIIGNALVVCSDEEGDTISCVSSLEEIKKQVRFHSGFYQQIRAFAS